MGRLDNQAPAASPPSSPLTHFTHPHELHPFSLYNPQTLCSGCKLQSSGIMYTCIPCNFTLHQSCANLPRIITHPSHSSCSLSLLTVSSYHGGIFSCNACSRRGDGWNYHCPRCEYDLHVSCATRPLKIRHQAHSSCELELTFKNPYANANGFSCDICRKIGSKQWLYRCNSCEFDVHLDCTTAAPVAASVRHNQLMDSLSAPPLAAAPVNSYLGPPPQPHLMPSPSTGSIGNPYAVNPYQVPVNAGVAYGYIPGNEQMLMRDESMGPMQNNQYSMGAGGLMNPSLEAFVEAPFQQTAGQTVMQDAVEGGGGGGGGDGGGGYDQGGGDMSLY